MNSEKRNMLGRYFLLLFFGVADVAFAQEAATSQNTMQPQETTSSSISLPGQALIEGTLSGLAGGVNVLNVQQCTAKIHVNCDALPTWEQKDLCTQQLLQTNDALCVQTQLLYQKYGMLPNKIQAFGPITVFTLLHIGDGQESFHMIDQNGNLINLADDQNVAISQNANFLKVQKVNPGAGMLPFISGKASEVPQVIMPTALGNQKGESDKMQLIFPQVINVPPCMACQTVAVADIAYLFSYPAGSFLGIKWLKMAPVPKVKPDVVDQD
jgi:hypothetical protein